MDGIIVKKGGILTGKKWFYDKEKDFGEYRYLDISKNKVLLLLKTTVELEEGFTVRDWFQTMINYPDFQKLDGYMKIFIDEYFKCPPEGCIKDDYKDMIICCRKIVSYQKYKGMDIPECDIFNDIYARDEKTDTNYSISFMPLADYIDLPMKYVNGYICEDTYPWENEKPLQVHTKMNYTLYDFVTDYIWEVSFYGTPEETRKKEKELNDISDSIDRGECELIPWDEVKKKWEENDNE